MIVVSSLKPNTHATSPRSTRMEHITAAMPTMNGPLKTSLPRIAPSPMSSCPRSWEITVVASSDMEAPTATTVAPMTNSGMPCATAIPRAPLTIKNPEPTKNANPPASCSPTSRCPPASAPAAALRSLTAKEITRASQAKKNASNATPSARESWSSKRSAPTATGTSSARENRAARWRADTKSSIDAAPRRGSAPR